MNKKLVTLLKLPDYGFSKSVIHWIASYLTSCEQAVIDDKDNHSIFLKFNIGVSQVSVLGPLLFSLYVNDLYLRLDHDICHIMYADDLQIYISCQLVEFDAISTNISTNADRIMSWATSNHLKLNVNKT